VADTPINQFLWDITLPAVRAAWDAGRDFAESGGKYVPRVARPQYKENEFGWPSTLAPSSFDRLAEDALINWRDMFGPEVVPGLVEVEVAVPRSRPAVW
jgi:hypothetical protein